MVKKSLKRRSKSPKRSDRTSKSPKSVFKKFMSKYKPKSKPTPKHLPPLNEDVIANIMSYLPTQDKIKSSAVSKTWNNAANLYDNKLVDVTYNQIKTPSFEKWFNFHPKAKLNVMVKDFNMKDDKNLFKVLYNYRNNIINLRIDGNLKQLPECIGEFKQLRVLELDCLLTSLPNNIGELSNLIKLDLQFNNLASLPESIGNLSNLQTLNLFNNSLTSLPNSIGNLTKLQTLVLGFNQLTSLPTSFSVATVDKNIRISYDLLILISKNEYLKIKID